MEFGWISVFGAVIVILMMIPNIFYAIRNKDEKNKCTNRIMNVLEQVGRYACIILMWIPLLVWKFGFSSVFGMILYLIGNGCLLAAYWIIFACYLRKKTRKRAVALAVLPVCIFLLSGLLLRHWLLAVFALLFGIGHIYVTQENVSGSDDGSRSL